MTTIASAADKSIVTLEGLGSAGHPHPLQQSFIDEQAILCGYCANGIIITAAALLQSVGIGSIAAFRTLQPQCPLFSKADVPTSENQPFLRSAFGQERTKELLSELNT